MGKTTKAADVVEALPDGSTIMVGGFMAIGSPRRLARSEPASGSVAQKALTNSPLARRGRYCSFCSAVPLRLIPREPMPTLVP